MTIDNLINQKGYRLHHLKIICIATCIVIIEGIHLNLMSAMLIPITNFFHLDTLNVQTVSGIIFVGLGIGSLLIGPITNSFGREKTIVVSLLSLTILHLAMVLTESFLMFTIIRFKIGFFIGLLTPIALNVCCEILPINNRAFVLTAIWSGFPVGFILIAISMYFVMPEYSIIHIKPILLIQLIFIILTTLFTVLCFSDSERNLLLSGYTKQAFAMLEESNSIELNELSRKGILQDIYSWKLSNESGLGDLMTGRYRYVTFLLIGLFSLAANVDNGPNLISSVTLEKLGIFPEAKLEAREIITTQIRVSIMLLVANILGGVLCEVKCLGRRITLLISFVLAFLSCCVLIVIPAKFNYMFPVVSFFSNIGNNVINTYASEIYPTQIRDSALGLLYFWDRIGGFISQFLFFGLFQIAVMLPYYLLTFIFLLIVIIVMTLPYETAGMPIDVELESKSLWGIVL